MPSGNDNDKGSYNGNESGERMGDRAASRGPKRDRTPSAPPAPFPEAAGPDGAAGGNGGHSQRGQHAQHAQWVREAVARYERPLVRYAAHVTGDAERARDVVQDAFLKLCDHDREKIGSHLAEWLYTVCRNLAIDVKRKERRMRLLSEAQADSFVTDDPAPAESAEREDSMSSVLRAMDDLPENQQECIRLKFQHGLSYKQISEVTRLTVTNVGFLIHTGLKALRKQLAEV